MTTGTGVRGGWEGLVYWQGGNITSPFLDMFNLVLTNFDVCCKPFSIWGTTSVVPLS
jgi:hypothetical protein